MSSTSIRQVHPQIWTFTQPFSRFGFIKIGLRGAVIKLSNNDLFVFNPVNTKEDGDLIKAKLDQIGKVRWLACPNLKHHLYVKTYKDWYPEAQVIGMEGLPEKKKDVHFDIVHGENYNTQKWGFQDEIESAYFSAFGNKDVVYYHRPSKTIFVADVFFNLPSYEAYSMTKISPTSGFSSKIANSIMNPNSRAQSRFLLFASMFRKQEVRKFAKKVAEWDFDRIVMCHGEIIEKGGKEAWKNLYKPYL